MKTKYREPLAKVSEKDFEKSLPEELESIGYRFLNLSSLRSLLDDRFLSTGACQGSSYFILLMLYSYFVADTVQTKVTDAQMTKVDGRYMIATEYRPFVNYDAWYRFKFNSGTIQNEAIRLKGKTVKIKKYGWRIPLFSEYENVVKIEEVKEKK